MSSSLRMSGAVANHGDGSAEHSMLEDDVYEAPMVSDDQRAPGDGEDTADSESGSDDAKQAVVRRPATNVLVAARENAHEPVSEPQQASLELVSCCEYLS